MRVIAIAALAASLVANAQKCVTVPGPAREGAVTTETVCGEARDRKEMNANTASALTSAGLAYLLVVRPAMQAQRNQALNALQGQFSSTYEELDSLSAVPVPYLTHRSADKQATIKGHSLGETWATFVEHSPLLRMGVARCLSQVRPNPARNRKKITYNPCSAAWRINDDPAADLTMTCVLPSSGAGKDFICQDFAGEATFTSGHLSAMKVLIFEDWKQVSGDVLARFGPQDAADAEGSLLIWNTDVDHLVATSIPQGTALSWMTATEYSSLSAASRPPAPRNSLE